MVCWLVQQQDIGLSGKRAGQQDTALQPAGKTLKLLFGGQVHFLHQLFDADIGLPLLLGSPHAESRMDHLEDRSLDSLRHLLGQAGQDDAVRLSDLSLLRFLLAGDDAHDAGLAGTITSHKTDALARIDLEVNLIKERSVGVAEGNAAELEKGHGEK